MPNGGTDNCGNCRHNRKNQVSANAKTAHQATRSHFCSVHRIPLAKAYWTYCENIYLSKTDVELTINAVGLSSSGYSRIPWLGRTAPSITNSIHSCDICGQVEGGPDGLRQIIPSLSIDNVFCSNEHYIEWAETIKGQVSFARLYDIGRNEMHIAVLEGDFDLTQVANSVRLDEQDHFGWSPLHLAAYLGEREVVSQLLEGGANAALSTFMGVKPIQLAGSEGHTEIVSLLAPHSFPDDSTKEQALIDAAHDGNLEVVEVLVKSGVNIDCTDYRGRTPLFMAVWGDRYTTAVYLLDQGANISIIDDYGNSIQSIVETWYSRGKSDLHKLVLDWVELSSED